MKRAFVNILTYERAGRGLQWHNLYQEYYNYRVYNAFYMFFVTFVLCLFLGIYLTNILKLTKEDSDEGLRLPWYYPVSPSYWCR